MDQSMVAAKTFVLKTNIHCSGCEKKIKRLLQNIGGVHRISIDATQGKIVVSGTIDRQTLLKLLQRQGEKSGLMWEPMIDQKDVQIIKRPKSPVNDYHVIHDQDVVSQLQKLSEIKGVKSVEVTREGMKITFKDDYENDQDFINGKSETSSRNSQEKSKYCGEQVVNDEGDFQGNHEPCCSRNQTMHKNYCHGCQPSHCGCMDPRKSIAQGIPWPGYFPSAPPEVVPLYYPPPAPPPQEMVYNHPFYSTFSDDNPRSCIIM